MPNIVKDGREQPLRALLKSGTRLSSAEARALADRALTAQREDEVVGHVRDAATRAKTDPILWQYSALLHRALDDRRAAIRDFEIAQALAPASAKIAHGLAQTRFEAGLASVDHFAAASRLAPFDASILLGQAGAIFAAEGFTAARRRLDEVLAQEPRWLDGQRQLVKMAWIAGQGDAALSHLHDVARRHAREPGLWAVTLELLLQARRFDRVLNAGSEARAHLGDQTFIAVAEAAALAESGQLTGDAELFDRDGLRNDSGAALYHVRHLLRHGRPDQALQVMASWLDTPSATDFVPYTEIATRLISPQPSEKFAEQLVQVVDLKADLSIENLTQLLRDLHHAGEPHIDQSVRGGTQTDGVLFARIDPAIEEARERLRQVVSNYAAAFPKEGSSRERPYIPAAGRVRFAGSWSVRLRPGGQHTNHVHPAGWISSALYIDLPESVGSASREGWLKLGEPPADLGLGLEPTRWVEPKVGRLVLFPSTMWHGTEPFSSGERLTIAFDIAYPAAR